MLRKGKEVVEPVLRKEVLGLRPFLYAELTGSEPQGREYSFGEIIPVNGSVLSRNGRCRAAHVRSPEKVSGYGYAHAECGITFLHDYYVDY